MLVITYPCFYIVDFFLLNKLNHPTYKFVLAGVHLLGLVISVIFLLLYHNKIRLQKGTVINCYILLYLLIGAVSSINSQLYTGNIYAYIIILFAVAVVLPVQPTNLLFFYLGIHLFFAAGLFAMEPDSYSFLIKLINSTGIAVISFTIALAFYTFRKNDFANKQKLRLQEESFRQLFNFNPQPLILIKLDGNEILLMNQQAMKYYQLTKTDAVDASFPFRNPAEKEEVLNRLQAQQSLKNYVTEQQITPRLKKWALLNFEWVEYLNSPCLLIGTTDITDLKKKEAELLKHASIDMLTGVRNRRSGIELLQWQLRQGLNGEEFVLCYIDINNLKVVNDRFDHAVGDDLIKSCCEVIANRIDDDDVLFRLGGDEFIVIFFGKQMEDVELIWKKIQLAFQAMNDARQKPYQISASHGCCPYKPGTPVTLEELLETADQAMYKNKVEHKKGEKRG